MDEYLCFLFPKCYPYIMNGRFITDHGQYRAGHDVVEEALVERFPFMLGIMRSQEFWVRLKTRDDHKNTLSRNKFILWSVSP